MWPLVEVLVYSETCTIAGAFVLIDRFAMLVEARSRCNSLGRLAAHHRVLFFYGVVPHTLATMGDTQLNFIIYTLAGNTDRMMGREAKYIYIYIYIISTINISAILLLQSVSW